MNTAAPQPADPAYLATLGLQRAPFLDQIDDRFFYADPALVQRLDLLQHLTQFGDMLLGVLGPAGSGKSTLLQQFMTRGGTTWRCCRINAAQIDQPGELLAKLSACFTPDASPDPERTKAALLRQFQSLRLASQLPVILIDDAHILPDPAFNSLLELGGNARATLKLVRVVLFAEPTLEQKLVQAGLHSPQQPLLHSLEIPTFDVQQSAAYLMYRLAVAGYSGDSPFSLTEIRALHKAAEGQPGKLNVLAHETLMERAGRIAARRKTAVGAAGETSDPGPSQRRKGLAILGGVLVLAAAGGYLLQSGLLQAPAPTEVDFALAPVPGPDTPPEMADSAGDAVPPQEATAEQASSDPAPDPPPPAPASDATVAAPALELTVPAGVSQPEQASGPSAAEPEPSPTAAAPLANTVVPAPAIAPAAPAEAATAPAASVTPAPSRTPTEPPPAAAEVAVPEPASSRPAAAAAGPAPESAAAAAAPPASDAATPPAAAATVLREDWLRERPAAHYTLQLLGVRSEASLRSYLAQYKPPGPVAYFRTEYKGGEWFVLVQGDYASMAAARGAVSALPAAIRKAKPWPRSFASVHADLEKTPE